VQVIITAVGPDHRGLADPIIHHVTGQGANIAEIQMYDHDEAALFAMLCRIELPSEQYTSMQPAMNEIGRQKGLSIRVWSPEARANKPRLAICTTYRTEPALALLRAIRDGHVPAQAAVVIGNRPTCRSVAEQFGVDWQHIGDAQGNVDDERLVGLCDEYNVDYIVLARYMRILSREFAPRVIAQLPWHAAVSRCPFIPDAHLRGNVPLHRAGIRCGKSDYLSIDLHGSAGHETG
jgi:formyltetrahydrofolate deformylase